MRSIRSAFSRLSSRPTPVVATNMSIDSWCHHLRIQPTRFITKIEICTAIAAGKNAPGVLMDKSHLHTFLRVSLTPTSTPPSPSEDVLLIERVLSAEGAYHSVTPLSGVFAYGGSLFHPEIHDRICVISDGPSTALAHRLQVERTLAFGDNRDDDSPSGVQQLTLAQFAQILEFVSRMTALICAGGDCKFQSRSFAFTCLAALTPSLPPSVPTRGANMNAKCEPEVVDDSVFESGAESFLGQISWVVRDRDSMQALRLMDALKVGTRVTAGLCH